MPWMKRGTEIRWVSDHMVMNMVGEGWMEMDRNPNQRSMAPPFARLPSGPAPGVDVGKAKHGTQFPQVNISDRGDKTIVPPAVWGAYAAQSGVRTGPSVATRWLRDNVPDPDRYRITRWEIVNYTPGGAPVFEATWTAPGASMGLWGQSSDIVKRARFTLPEPEGAASTAAQDQLDNFLATQERDLANYFKLASDGALSTGEANKLQARIEEVTRLGNLPRGLVESGFNMADPRQVANEIASVLGNERLGSPDRRKKLAEMVLGEIESSIMGIDMGQLAPAATEGGNPAVDEAETRADNMLASLLAALAGGRGGGGSQPIYQPPDRREVEENVRNYLGMVMPSRFDDTLVKKLTERYMTDHRRSYDSPDSGVRPWYSVKEEVHKLKEYQQIHALRPDSIPEEEWATRYMIAIENAGIPEGMRDRTAANYATIGATMPAASAGAFRMREHQTGRPQPVFLQNMRNAARALANKF